MINKLNLIINYGISPLENISKEERRKRIEEFTSNLSYHNYEQLFNEINESLFDEKISAQEKEQLVFKVIECIRLYSKFEDNISMFPKEIQILYNSYSELRRVLLGIEAFLKKDVLAIFNVNEIIMFYTDYLGNPKHEQFIKLCYNLIQNTNNMIIREYQKLDYDGVMRKSKLDADIVKSFEEKVEQIKRGKN